MPIARFVESERPALLELHLLRLGLAADRASKLSRDDGLGHLLITGASKAALALVQASHPGLSLVPGDEERARGSLLLSGSHEALEALASALAAQGPETAPTGLAIARALRSQTEPPAPTQIGRRLFSWGSRTFVMGIVNVTPDSFSDGGHFAKADDAVAHGERLAAEGADILDIGGESTRPGAEPVGAQQEIDRVVPVIEALSRRVEVPLSIDTTKAEVAEMAVKAGASLVNDISGFKFDTAMAPAIANSGAAACAMHIQGVPRSMQHSPSYFDVVGEVMEQLQASVDHALRCGVAPGKVLVDPGLGFGKTADHNLFLLRNLAQLKSLGLPILVGASRKSFIGKLTGLPVEARLPGSLAILSAAILGGADVVRVHDIAESVAAAKMVDAVARAREGGFAFLPRS